ncbi:unnamed protein product [Sphagnum balticum]
MYSTSYGQMLLIGAVQTAAYAMAYAETCTQITSAVDTGRLGEATGLAATVTSERCARNIMSLHVQQNPQNAIQRSRISAFF